MPLTVSIRLSITWRWWRQDQDDVLRRILWRCRTQQLTVSWRGVPPPTPTSGSRLVQGHRRLGPGARRKRRQPGDEWQPACSHSRRPGGRRPPGRGSARCTREDDVDKMMVIQRECRVALDRRRDRIDLNGPMSCGTSWVTTQWRSTTGAARRVHPRKARPLQVQARNIPMAASWSPTTQRSRRQDQCDRFTEDLADAAAQARHEES